MAELDVSGVVRQGCGSLGGCAYFIDLVGNNGSWKAEFKHLGPGIDLADPEGLPATVTAGTYTLTLSSVLVSDDGGELGPADATCSTILNLRANERMRVKGTFDLGSCEVGVAS